MSGKHIEVIGAAELQKQLKGLVFVSEYLGPAKQKAARIVKSTIRAEAPVDDGELRDSIKINPKKLRKRGRGNVLVAAEYSSTMKHAHLVEFGARGGEMPANPFFSRGYAKSRGEALAAIEAGVQAAIDKAIK